MLVQPTPTTTRKKYLEKMQIFIKTLTGRKQQYNFEGDSSVLSVKQTLQEKVGFCIEN